MSKKLSDAIQAAELFLAQTDPVMATLIDGYGPVELAPRTDYFMSLSRSIVGQQVSVAAARSIFARYEAGTRLDPSAIEVMELDELREFGLSRQKARYIKDLAGHFVEDPAVFNHLETLDDQTVINELTSVKGIGEWTAHMFLMSTLARLDVFAPDDAGLQRAIKTHYSPARLKKPKDFNRFAERWRPHRTIASLYLWKSIDTTPE